MVRPLKRSLSPRRLAILLGAWALAAGAAILIALALDSPVGEGARDEARPVAPDMVAIPEEGLAVEGLPPLALALDRPPPAEVAALPPIRQVGRLRELAAGGDPRRLVELGSVLQLLGDGEGARAAYAEALRRSPGDPAARVGLALVEGATGPEGAERARAALARLAAERPRDQLVSFNQGWLAVYRRDADGARAAWERTVALDPATRLGRTAAALLGALEEGASRRSP